MHRTTVPKTTVDIDGHLGSGKDDVGSPPNPRQNHEVDPVPQSASMQRSAHAHFGGGVTASSGLHPAQCISGRGRWPFGCHARLRALWTVASLADAISGMTTAPSAAINNG